jgi:aminoglycoside phosphotransferase (APT) family kinase protein
MAVKVPGALLGSGRNADAYDIGDGRVLRRYRDGRDSQRVAGEAQVMAHARACGVPVPEVFDVSGADIVMARAAGPTMLDVLGRRPWTLRAHASELARLHDLVHQVPASGLVGLALWSPFGDQPGDDHVLLHRDLHPQNVILTGNGPMIIDWEGASFGPAIADVALTWVIVGYSEIPPGPRLQAAVMRAFQTAFTRSFVRAAGPLDQSWRHTAIRLRLGDPNVLPSEAVRLERLAAAVTGRPSRPRRRRRGGSRPAGRSRSGGRSCRWAR